MHHFLTLHLVQCLMGFTKHVRTHCRAQSCSKCTSRCSPVAATPIGIAEEFDCVAGGQAAAGAPAAVRAGR